MDLTRLELVNLSDANRALSQLSYRPVEREIILLTRISIASSPPTGRLSTPNEPPKRFRSFTLQCECSAHPAELQALGSQNYSFNRGAIALRR